MIIVSISNAIHDNAVAVANDYDVLAAIQKERLTRIKGDGAPGYKKGGLCAPLMTEALSIAGVSPEQVEQVVTMRGVLPFECFNFDFFRNLKCRIKVVLGKNVLHVVSSQMHKRGTLDLSQVLKRETFLEGCGLSGHLPLMDGNHHYAHALSALFHTDWDNALVYTADGGGDGAYYSASHFDGRQIHSLFGGDRELLSPTFKGGHSVGLVYAAMTEALGYRRNRHEGKLTGLASFGKPVAVDEIKKHFTVRDDGLIATRLSSNRKMEQCIKQIGVALSPADAAASVQAFLEDAVLSAIGIYLQKTGAKKIALAGGVFANVALNRRIAALPEVEEVFIFPGMGDEGLAIGGIYDFLLRRDGMDTWSASRRRLQTVYWGGAHDEAAQALFNQSAQRLDGGDETPAQTAARLLAAGEIVAIYHGRMEFGPRALGARSILANPADAAINQTLNERLQRTEFMPFAP